MRNLSALFVLLVWFVGEGVGQDHSQAAFDHPDRATVLLIETVNTFLVPALDDLGITYDYFLGDDYSEIDLYGYDHVFVAMNGGFVEDASVVRAASYAKEGGHLHFWGGTTHEPYMEALNLYLLPCDLDSLSWAWPEEPHSTIEHIGHFLANGLPVTHNFTTSNPAAYQTRAFGGPATVVAVNGDKHPQLLTRSFGAGRFDICVNNPGVSDWSTADLVWGKQVVWNVLNGLPSIIVAPQPAGIPAPWLLEGPDGFLLEGAGYAVVTTSLPGDYTLTWQPVFGWTSPDSLVQNTQVERFGSPPTFVGVYTDPPFTAVVDGPLADAGPAAGACLVDYDDDDDIDIYQCNDGTPNLLLRNDGDLVFTDVASGELADAGPSRAAAWADLDNDGDQDLYLARYQAANRMLIQQPSGEFTDIALYGTDDSGPAASVSWCDFDRDGLLDLFLANDGADHRLFRSIGDPGAGFFVFVLFTSPVVFTTGPGRGASWCDYDQDGFPDLYVSQEVAPDRLIDNVDGLAFVLNNQVADHRSGRAAMWSDFDADGDWDLYVVNNGQANGLYRRSGENFLGDPDPVLSSTGRDLGVAVADFDNDGTLDVYLARWNDSDHLIMGGSDGVYRPCPLAIQETDFGCVSVACGDLDGDGGLDLYVSRDGFPNLLLRNTIIDRGHWLQCDLVGGAENRDAVGAVVRLVTGDHTQMRQVTAGGIGLAQHARVVAFGLGSATVADSLIVRWPNGDQQIITDLAADQRLTIHQGQVSSAQVDDVPRATRLLEARPNPFNPMTTVSFDLARRGSVNLEIFSLRGRRVATLVNETLPEGRHQAAWAGCDATGRPVASGTYICRMVTEDGEHSIRVSLVK